MGLIKSVDAPVHVSAFSMRDIEAQARAILDTGRREAEQVKQSARDQGLAEGRAAGIEEGRRLGRDEAMAQHAAELLGLINSLAQAIGELDRMKQSLEADAQREAVDLAVAIARRVTKRQGAFDPTVLLENLSQAMKLVGQGGQDGHGGQGGEVRIALHPSQIQLLRQQLPRLQAQWPGVSGVELIEDAEVLPGGCRIFCRHGQIDADLESQLDRVVADLLPPPDLSGESGCA